MVGTITSAVRGREARSRRYGSISYFVMSAFGGASAALAAAGLGSLVLGSLPSRSGWRLFGGIALLAALREFGAFGPTRLRRSRQVSESWRRRFPPIVAWGMYGYGLGVGLVTLVPFWSTYAFLVGCAVLGDFGVAAIAGALYGGARAALAAPLGIRGGAGSGADLRRMSEMARAAGLVRGVNATALLVISLSLLIAACR
jgi:hypothetical protein